MQTKECLNPGEIKRGNRNAEWRRYPLILSVVKARETYLFSAFRGGSKEDVSDVYLSRETALFSPKPLRSDVSRGNEDGLSR